MKTGPGAVLFGFVLECIGGVIVFWYLAAIVFAALRVCMRSSSSGQRWRLFRKLWLTISAGGLAVTGLLVILEDIALFAIYFLHFREVYQPVLRFLLCCAVLCVGLGLLWLSKIVDKKWGQ